MLLSVCPADQIADDNQRGCSVSIRYMRGSTLRYQSFVESVTQLLSDCYADLMHTANGTVSSVAVAFQTSKLAHASAWPSQQLSKKVCLVCLTKTLTSLSRASQAAC